MHRGQRRKSSSKKTGNKWSSIDKGIKATLSGETLSSHIGAEENSANASPSCQITVGYTLVQNYKAK